MENAELQVALLRELASHKETLALYQSEIGPRTEHCCPVCNNRIYGVLRGPVNPGQPFVHAECALRVENEQLKKEVRELQEILDNVPLPDIKREVVTEDIATQEV